MFRAGATEVKESRRVAFESLLDLLRVQIDKASTELINVFLEVDEDASECHSESSEARSEARSEDSPKNSTSPAKKNKPSNTKAEKVLGISTSGTQNTRTPSSKAGAAKRSTHKSTHKSTRASIKEVENKYSGGDDRSIASFFLVILVAVIAVYVVGRLGQVRSVEEFWSVGRELREEFEQAVEGAIKGIQHKK
jgi:cobalamin biosynthesis Mg chelatase CobN